jgi:hypothetical protein
MAPDEVRAVSECGPYKAFKNGDLETYAGVFGGKKQNFQFFFRDGKLARIGVYLYEGQDPEAGAREWLTLYVELQNLFGDVETPANTAPATEATSDAFVETALKLVREPGKTQMAPVSQPKDARVFSSFMRTEAEGVKYYNVVLYFDAP